MFSFQHPLWSHRLPAGEGGAPPGFTMETEIVCVVEMGEGIVKKTLIGQEHNPRE